MTEGEVESVGFEEARQFSKQLTFYSFSRVTVSKILSSAVISSLLKPYVSQPK